VVGISLAAAHIGFIVAFYIIATHYGCLAPADVNYSDSVNTSFPWISGVAMRLLASMNEEFTSVVCDSFFAPSLVALDCRHPPSVSLELPAHNYPKEPAYIRGFEVGLIGIVAGIVMPALGILAT